MGWKRVCEGEQAVIYDSHGNGRLVVGPARVYLFSNTITFLRRFVATQFQYLEVKYRNGQKSNVSGPTEMFLNPIDMENIVMKEATILDANHLLVVYKQNLGQIERRIVQGPAVFVPTADEWLHEFIWHGSDPQDPGHWIPLKNKFNLLRQVPDQFYYNVRDVRTNDDTLLLVKLMLFVELVEVETMLNFTHDPMADFINAVSSDIITFASKTNYEEFLQQTHHLNSLETYPQLTSRAERIGFRVTKVVYCGYTASKALQNTHDTAIETRTRLKLEKESSEQEQNLREFSLKREKERSKLKQELERQQQDHKQELGRIKQKAELEMEKLRHEAQLKLDTAQAETTVAIKKAENEQQTVFMQRLKDMGVDMTKYTLSLIPESAVNKEVIVGPDSKV